MCAPAVIIGAVTAAISIGETIYSANQQQSISDANQQNALASAQAQRNQLSLQEMQQTDLANTSIYNIDQQSRMAQAQAHLQSGESGVEGVSVDLLLADMDRQRMTADYQTKENAAANLQQTEAQKQGVTAQAQNQINSVRPIPVGASVLQGLSGAVQGYGAYNQINNAGTSRISTSGQGVV